MPETSLTDIAVGLARLEGSVTAYRDSVQEYKQDNISIRADVDSKHKENRKSIHELRNDVQDLADRQLGQEMKIKQLLFYAALGGVAAGFLKEGIEFIFKIVH